MWFPAVISWHMFEARPLQQMGFAAGPLVTPDLVKRLDLNG
jgi:hypothetical protein